MKLFIIIAMFILVSCNHTGSQAIVGKPSNSKDTTITLKDTLGDISITIPNRYDTFLIWTHYSDCSSCGDEKYRFQSKILPIYMESGWYWHNLKDSIDQLTIEHSQYIRINNTLTDESVKFMHKRMLEEAKFDPIMYKDSAHFDTIQNINGRQFSIITSEYCNDTTKLYAKSVWGATLIKGNSVRFRFTLLTNKKDSITENFIRNSKELLCQVKSNDL